MSAFNKDNTNSRFHVTPRNDIESHLFEVTSPSPSSGGDLSPELGPYSTLGGYFSELEELNPEKRNALNNTVTSTSTSSNSSFYNTIYKYNKLKQNVSLDPVFYPNRRPSNSPHSVVGIPFYNERILVYNFLQRPTGLLAISYHIFVSVAVVYCLVLTIMSTSSGKQCLRPANGIHCSAIAVLYFSHDKHKH